jgi:hypothetical protein
VPFKSSVTLRFAEPFGIAPVDAADRNAARLARKEITDRITELMQRLTVHVPDEHHDLVGKIARFYHVAHRNDYERIAAVTRKVEDLSATHAAERHELETMLDEYFALADELKIYPGEERAERSTLLLLFALIPAYVGYALHWPILWATRRAVRRATTPLHALGSNQVMSGIAFTLIWYALVGTLFVALGVWKAGWSGIPPALGALILMAACGITASRAFRHVNMLVRGLLPSRRFRRYRVLGDALYTRLEEYRRLAEG